MRTRTTLTAALVLALTGAAGFWAGSGTRLAHEGSGEASSSGSDAVRAVAADPALDRVRSDETASNGAYRDGSDPGPNIASANLATPLPEENTPLIASLPALRAAAEAGSIEAIRRLFDYTRRCRLHAQARFGLDLALGLQEDLKNMAEGIGPKAVVAVTGEDGPGPRLKEMAEGAAGKMSEDDALCAGFEDPDDALRFEAQWRAALAGELEGLIRFVLEPAIDVGRAWQQLDRIERYRDRAPAFLQQALGAGSAQAALHLMHAHDPGWKRSEAEIDKKGPSTVNRVVLDSFPPIPLRQVVRQDAAIAWRYASLCERVCPDHAQERARAVLDRLRPDLDADTRARAEEEAARLREAHFAGVREVAWFPDLNDQPAPDGPPAGP